MEVCKTVGADLALQFEVLHDAVKDLFGGFRPENLQNVRRLGRFQTRLRAAGADGKDLCVSLEIDLGYDRESIKVTAEVKWTRKGSDMIPEVCVGISVPSASEVQAAEFVWRSERWAEVARVACGAQRFAATALRRLLREKGITKEV